MLTYEYGNSEASAVLIQPVDEHSLPEMENEVREIQKMTSVDFKLLAVVVEHWNDDLSPWQAPAVFGKEAFGGGAAQTLAEILTLCADNTKKYYIGGYSLAGLFSLWAAYQTDVFAGVAAASPSVWFPGFLDDMQTHEMGSRTIYLSLGDREAKTRNSLMATVGVCIRECYAYFKEIGINCTLEWNPGNHFKEPDVRTAKAFGWVLGGVDDVI